MSNNINRLDNYRKNIDFHSIFSVSLLIIFFFTFSCKNKKDEEIKVIENNDYLQIGVAHNLALQSFFKEFKSSENKNLTFEQSLILWSKRLTI